MTKTERIWLIVGFLALAVIIILEVRSARNATLAAQNQYGTPDSTNPIPPGQVGGPTDGSDAIAAGVGPWYLYYNTPGTYRLLPPLVNTMMAPAAVSTSNTGSTPTCSTC